MANYANLPAATPEGGLNRYMQDIRKFPMLEPEEEYMLAKAWVERQDSAAAHKMVTSHLRLAAKIAMGYRGYGLPQAEVVSEANVGLMQAVKKFDPEKGFRLATYAMWWIRASIQEYVLRSWSLVKMGTTSGQKKLFFNLRKAWLLEEEGTKNEVKHLKIDIRDCGWLERLLKAENINASDCGVVGCHVCNALSDELIDECLNAHVEFFVMGCCHGSTSRQGKSYKESAKELGVSLGLLVDTARYGVIAQREGYVAKIRTIDSKITPENRILIGLYDERETEEASVKHSKEALRKVAKVYERVFSKERLVEKDEE